MAYFGNETSDWRELEAALKQNRELDALLVSEQTRYAAKCKEANELKSAKDEALYRLQHEAERAAQAEKVGKKQSDELKQWQTKGQQMESALDQANRSIKDLQKELHLLQSDLDAASASGSQATSAHTALLGVKTTLENRVRQLEAQVHAKDVELAQNKAHGGSDRNRFGYSSTNIVPAAPTDADAARVAALEDKVQSLQAENEQLSAKVQQQSSSHAVQATPLRTSTGPSRPRSSMGFNQSFGGSGIPLPSSRIPAPSTANAGLGTKRRRSSSFSVNASGPAGSASATAAVARLERDLSETRATLVSTEQDLEAAKLRSAKAERELLKAENQVMAVERAAKSETESLRNRLDDMQDEVALAREQLVERTAEMKDEANNRERGLHEALAEAQRKADAAERDLKGLEKEKARLEAEVDRLQNEAGEASDIRRSEEAMRQEAAAAKAGLESAQAEMAQARQAVDAVRQESADADARAAAAQERLQNVEADLVSATSAAAESQQALATLQAHITHLETTLSSNAASAETSLTAAGARVAELEALVAHHEASASASQAGQVLLAETQEAVARLQSELVEAKARVEALTAEKDALEQVQATLNQEREMWVSREKAMAEQSHASDEQIKSVKDQVTALQTEVGTLANERHLLEADLAATQIELRRAEDEVLNLSTDLAVKQQEVVAATTAVETASQEAAALRATSEELDQRMAASTTELTIVTARVAELERELAARPIRSFDDADVLSLRQSLADAKSSHEDASQAFDEQVALLAAAHQKIRDLETLEWGASQGRDEALGKVEQLSKALSDLATEKDEASFVAQQHLSAVQADVVRLEAEREEALTAVQVVQAEMDRRVAEVEAMADKSERVDSLEEHIQAMRTAITEHEARAEEAQRRIETLTADLEIATAKAEVVEAEAATLRKKLDDGDSARAAGEAEAGARVDQVQQQLDATTARLRSLQSEAESLAVAEKEARDEVERLRTDWQRQSTADHERINALSVDLEASASRLAAAQSDLAMARLEASRLQVATPEYARVEPQMNAELEKAALLIARLRGERDEVLVKLDFAVREKDAAVASSADAATAANNEAILALLHLRAGHLVALAAANARRPQQMVLPQELQTVQSQLDVQAPGNQLQLGQEAASLATGDVQAALEGQLQDANAQVARTQASLQAASEAIQTLEAKLGFVEAELTSARTDFAAAMVSASVSSEEAERAKSEVETATEEVGRLRAETTALQALVEGQSARLSAERTRADELEVSVAAQREVVADLNRQLEGAVADKSTAEAALSTARDDVEATRTLLLNAREEVVVLEAQLSAARSAQQTELEELRVSLRSAEDVSTRQQELETNVVDHLARITQLENQLASSTATIDAANATVRQLQADHNAKMAELVADLDFAKDEAARRSILSDEAHSLSASLQTSVDALEQERGELQHDLRLLQQKAAALENELAETQSKTEHIRSTTSGTESLRRQEAEAREAVATLQSELEESRLQLQAYEQHLQSEFEPLVEDFNLATAEVERLQQELADRVDIEKQTTEHSSKQAQDLASLQAKFDSLRATQEAASAEAQRLSGLLAERTEALSRMEAGLAASSVVSEAATASAAEASRQVADLEARLDLKIAEVGDAEDQLLLQMKENKRALNTIQKLKDRVQALQRTASASGPAGADAAPTGPIVGPDAVTNPNDASRKRKLDSVLGARGDKAEPALVGPKREPVDRRAVKPAPKQSDPPKSATKPSVKPRHIESLEELKPPGPDETYQSTRRSRAVLGERQPNAIAPAQAPPRSSGDKPVVAKASDAKKATLPASGKSTANLLASIQALRRKQQLATQQQAQEEAA